VWNHRLFLQEQFGPFRKYHNGTQKVLTRGPPSILSNGYQGLLPWG